MNSLLYYWYNLLVYFFQIGSISPSIIVVLVRPLSAVLFWAINIVSYIVLQTCCLIFNNLYNFLRLQSITIFYDTFDGITLTVAISTPSLFTICVYLQRRLKTCTHLGTEVLNFSTKVLDGIFLTWSRSTTGWAYLMNIGREARPIGIMK